MKRIFKYIGIISFVIVSFMITEKTSMVIRETDDIMIQINAEKSKYEKDSIDAKIEQNKIIPGQYGRKVNEKKTYEVMKKYGKYNPNSYVYEKIKPKTSIEDIYDKYIESGNNMKKEVSIIIIAAHGEEETIQYQKVTILKDNNESNYNQHFTLNQYCYIEKYDKTKIDKCKMQKKHTIKITPITKNLLQEVKKTLKNGKIITITLNNNTKKELELTINYIKNKGYKIVKIEELLNEKNTD